MSTDPFASPAAPSGGVEWEALNGSLLLVEVESIEAKVSTSFGEKEAVRGTVHVLDGASAGEVHADTLIFPKVLIGQLRSRTGQKVLGRLGQGSAKVGQKPPWLLNDPTDEDKALGVKYLAGQMSTAAAPPF